MPNRKTIVVAGATGAQGGGLARAILEDGNRDFAVRAITRNSKSARALELEKAGAEVVEADMDDLTSLHAAFSGAYAAFCVTNFWEHFSPEKEIAQAGNLAEAAAVAGLEHVIWSTLEDTRQWVALDDDRMPTLMGKYKVPHFDAKGEANAQFKTRGVPTTFLLTSFYWENFIHLGLGPQRGPTGALSVSLPMGKGKLPGIATEDIGKCAYGILKRGSRYIGETIGIAGEHLTVAEMADALSRALGEPVTYNDVSAEIYRQFDFPGAEDLGNMFQFKRDFNDEFCRARSVSESRQLNPELLDFAAWLGRNRNKIPLE